MLVRHLAAAALTATYMVTPAAALPPAYPRLATAISTPYTTSPPAKRDQPLPRSAIAPDAEKLLGEMPGLKRGRHPAVIGGVSKLVEGVERVQAARTAIREKLKAVDDHLDEVVDRAAAGEFTTTVPGNQVVRTPSGRLDYPDRTVDDGASRVFMATLMRNAIWQNAPNELTDATAVAMEQARLEAWAEMLPRLNGIYPAKKLAAGGVELRIDTAANIVTATNRTKQPLTNMTLAVELAPADTAPEPACYQVYFVPKLDPDRSIWLAPLQARNCQPRKYTLRRPDSFAFLGLRKDELNHFVSFLSLDELVEARFVVWTAEGKQPEQSVRFPEQATREAGREMTETYRNLVGEVGRSPTNKQLAELVKTPLWAFAQQTARRTQAYLSVDAEAYKRAGRLLVSPTAFLAAERERERQITDRISTPGQVYVGEWRFLPKIGGSLVDPKYMPRPDDAGPLALKVESRNPDTGTVMAILFDPVVPARWWRLQGQVVSDGSGTSELSLGWPVADPIADPKMAARPVKAAAEPVGPARFFAAPAGISLMPDEKGPGENNLFGTVGNAAKVSLKPTADPELAAVAKTVSAAADATEQAVVAVLRKEPIFTGQWQERGEQATKGPRAKSGVRHSGPMTVRFEGWRADTRELTVVLAADGKESRRPGKLARTPAGATVVELAGQEPEPERKTTRLRQTPREIDPLAPGATVHLSLADGRLSGRFRPVDMMPGLWVEMTLEPARSKK